MHVTDRASFLFQGYLVEDWSVDAAGGSVAVQLPASLVPELGDRCAVPYIAASGVDSIVVTGPRVVDANARAALALPDGEDVVEVPFAVVPELAKVAVAC